MTYHKPVSQPIIAGQGLGMRIAPCQPAGNNLHRSGGTGDWGVSGIPTGHAPSRSCTVPATDLSLLPNRGFMMAVRDKTAAMTMTAIAPKVR